MDKKAIMVGRKNPFKIARTTPNMTSSPIDGYSVSGSLDYFNASQSSNRYYSGQNGTLNFPEAINITHIKFGGYDNSWYYGTGATLTFYLKGVQVHSMTIYPITYANQTVSLATLISNAKTEIKADSVYHSYGWGSSWDGNGGQATTGKQFIGYVLR